MANIFTKLRNKFKKIGPGFITGAADDDPSGIATYSIAGAQYGYKMNWMTMFLLPAMIVIQEMCGRVGKTSGRGLAGVIKKFYSRKLLFLAVTLLAIANTINIGADLGIIASSMQMIFGWEFYIWLVVAGVVIILMEIIIPYKKYANILKWLALTLTVYVVTAFLVKQNWNQVLINTFIPHIELNLNYIMTMIGFLGTTISPYLFFWQASEEVEEEIDEGEIKDFNIHPETTRGEIKKLGFDTKVGMVFSNLMTFFIILTTAATLHANGITNIETPQQAALALKPLAGNFAYFLFAIGIIGIGLQSIPVLAGSVGYALSEAIGAKEGLSKKFSKAKTFYVIIAAATIIGLMMNLAQINIMKALYYSAVINGIAAVPLIAIIIKLADDERIVGKFKTKKRSRIVAWITFGFMLLSVLLMIYQIFGIKN
ncbi:Divalent metal cation transporter MntH [bioreactor metagenome]|uniref:Divalent metal cation transporter MntH n=1 Tax=bioreactor metagenome TaxID=1076179 RepID=A0A644XW62_9ZZZZ